MKKLLICLSTLALAISCGQENQQPTLNLVDRANFATTIDSKEVDLYTLTNSHGTTMQVTNFGGRVVSLWTADKDGHYEDITLGRPTLDEYINADVDRFLGAAVGRYANRIKDGKFSLDGVDYQLSTWSNGQCLHGGVKAFDKVVWSVDSLSSNAIYLSYFSKDMEEGFPGNVNVEMSYTLTENDSFYIEYKATTDKNTPLNLTNHAFFNLKGAGNGTINDHIMTIAASKFIPIDSLSIPTGDIAEVSGTPFDFRKAMEIGSRLGQEDAQLKLTTSYDHTFIIDRKSENGLEFAASLYEPTTGRYLEVWTTEPGIQFYAGGNFSNKTVGKEGKTYKKMEALALETQHFPNSVNVPSFPSTIVKPGETYHQICEYRFGVK